MLDIWLGWTFGWVDDLVGWVGSEFWVDLDGLVWRVGWDYIFGWDRELIGWEICLYWTFGWILHFIRLEVWLDWVGMQFWLAGFFIWLDSRLFFLIFFWVGHRLGWRMG